MVGLRNDTFVGDSGGHFGKRRDDGWQDRVGSVEEGKYADIISISGAPLVDITELERVKFVMIGGQVVRNEFKQ